MKNSFFLLACALFGAVVAGCEAKAPPPATGGGAAAPAAGSAAPAHDPNDVPITADDVERPEDYADAIVRIKSYRDKIKTETTTGTPALAHRSLDELDYVLQWLPEIAQEGDIPKEKWEEINTTARALRDSFNKVHTNIDAGEAPDYAAVDEEIDAAVDQLDAIDKE
jgi:hypothetical protein